VTALGAAALGFLVVSQPLVQLLPLAVIGAVLIVRWPAALPIAALVLCQEVLPAADEQGSGGLALTLGNQLYYGPDGTDDGQQTVLPIMVLLAVTAAVSAINILGRSQPAGVRLSRTGTAILVAIVALVAWTVLAGVRASGSLLAAVNQEAKPFLLLAFGFVVGVGIHHARREPAATKVATGAALVALLALAGADLATGRVGLGLDTQYPIFFDAAMSAAAGAVLLALVFHRNRGSGLPQVLVGLAALAIVILSLRRNVWVAVVVALVVALVVAHGRGTAARRLTLGTVSLVPVALLVPGLAATVGTRVYDTLYSLDNAADASTRGHITDLEIGWNYVLGSPIAGIGSRHPPLPGFVVQESSIVYVHNEWLLDWLRYGLVGVTLVTLVLGLLAARALALLRTHRSLTVVQTAAAMFVLMVPISAITAPFLSTTGRWPALLGIAAGIIAVARAPAGGSEPLPAAQQRRAGTGPSVPGMART